MQRSGEDSFLLVFGFVVAVGSILITAGLMVVIVDLILAIGAVLTPDPVTDVVEPISQL